MVLPPKMANSASAGVEAVINQRKDVAVQVAKTLSTAVPQYYHAAEFRDDKGAHDIIFSVADDYMSNVDAAMVNEQPTAFANLIEGAVSVLRCLNVSDGCCQSPVYQCCMC